MRRFLPPILVLLMLLMALPGALAAQRSVESSSGWQVADVLTLESGEDEYVALSPDGTRIAGIGADGGLCVWQVDGMDSECAGDVGAIRAESITWSPDSTAVAYSLDHVLLLVESDIFVYEITDGALHNLTDDGHEGPMGIAEPGMLVDGVPAWSPDSRELVFVRSQPADETFGTSIMRIDRAGGEPSRVHRLPLETPYGIFMPMHWLPDDSLLYTQVSLDGTDPSDGVWRVGLDGGDARRLLSGARGTDTAGPMLMSVAPESGLALVYASFVEQEAQFEAPEDPLAWLLDIETGEATPVPDLPPSAGQTPELAGRAQYAAFSPAGSAFMGVYSSAAEGTILAVTDVATGEVTVVASDVPGRPGRSLPTWAGDRFLLPEREQAALVTLVGPTEAAASPVASPAASANTAGGAWRVADTRELDLDARAPTLSPDGRWLAGQGPEGSFCIWDVETGVPACAGENLPIREETITWSPDGTAVAFALDAIRQGYESDIYVYELDSDQLTNLTDDGVEGGLLDTFDADPPGDDVPVWSPDGEQIAFARSRFGVDDEPGSTAIMRIDRSGGEPVEILRLDVDEPYAVWSPMRWLPNGTLVYSRLSMQADDAQNGLWVVDIDGGNPRQIVPGAEGTDIPAPVLVDVDAERGQAIALSWLLAGQRGRDAGQPLYWLVDLETGERTSLPVLPDDGSGPPAVLDASFSPDGATVLLVTLGEAGVTLMTLDPSTLAVAGVDGEPIQAALRSEATLVWASNDTVALHAPQGAVIVTLEPTGDVATASPEASPAASPVASGGGWRIAGERELSVDARYVTLAPDGQWLAGVGPDSTFCVWDIETLTPACDDERLPIREETITWSPDGTAVAFALDAIIRLYESDIYVYELDTGELTNLTDDGVEGDVLDTLDADAPIDDVPVWSPDGERIAFARSHWGADDEPGSTSIMVIDRAGGEPAELLPLDVEEPLAIWMPMHWLPDGTLLYSQIVRDIGDPRNGVWKVSVDDGSSPLQLVPGDEAGGVPGPKISDATDGQAIVYSYWLMGRFEVDAQTPLFWLVDVATGERAPLAVPGGEGWIIDAGFSPDGSTALLVTGAPTEGARRLMVLDVASGEITPLDTAPRDTPFAAGPPQWATNDTVLLQVPGGGDPLLVTLEPAS